MADPATDARRAWRRAKIYSEVDGLAGLLQGASFVLLGLFLLYVGTRHSAAWLLAWGAFACFSFWMDREETLAWLKARITYPRTGYAVPSEASPSPLARFPTAPVDGKGPHRSLAAMAEVSFAVLWILAFVWETSWIFALCCGLTALLFWWERKSPPWFSGGLLIAAVLAYALSLKRIPRIGLFILIIGTATIAKGAIRLIGFMRRHPTPPATDGGLDG